MSQAGGLRITLALIATLASGSCSSSSCNAYQMAGAGQVDKSAPIQSSRSIIVAAPPAMVWRLLTDMRRWPLWQPAITDVQMNGPARAGSHFTWNNGDTRIGSQVALVQAPEHLAWTGRASGLTAIHVWTLVPLRGGETLVRTEESMAVFPSSLFYSSSELDEANAEWLKRLKTAAEHH